ncbi:5-oxoprolinase [Arthrobacter sp. MYb23]|uniref:hydantoinase B/oxoprolinase family protein n=1 Tax=unclassified Arthrobacter TaxID=235627 RepID=UPI000CFAFB34|nr:MULTISPECIES: hydantoinase B/oxoprolinase family protein [unclassified Arthrobacter]PRB43048.1 5-oxoprolinase [Arthrobacter sp. MYb51]PRB98000.1 5-oxoprolinase [Arthrobacter sp. MYb23]
MTLTTTTPANPVALDPVDLEIARNRMESIAEEIGTTLIRTSYSPNIKDRRDCSAGVYRPSGELIAQAEHIPLHLGLMPTLVRRALDEIGREKLQPGDVLITNNPYIGGSHLPDTCIITPVFVGEEIVAVVANMAHHVDIGGITPGSMATHATEIFQEGIRIPPLRLYNAGELAKDLVALLLTNIRTPDKTRGDLMAQVSANMIGVRRVLEVIEERGIEYFHTACEALVDYSERRTRSAIAALPDGEGEFTDYLEHNGATEQRIPIAVKVIKRGDELTVDLTGSADQVAGAVNCSSAISDACVAYVVKVLADPTLPSNAGLMRPITVITRPGSVVSAEFPAPVANGNTQTSMRIVDALFGAFDKLSPGMAPAASCGSQNLLTIGGTDPATGIPYSYVETYGGGQGATASMSGADATHTHMTNTRNTPCEVIEREYPLRVEHYAIARGTGGEGQHSGGNGMIRELTLTRGTAIAVIATSRTTTQPWGLHGGQDGAPSHSWTTNQSGQRELPSMGQVALTEGASLGIQTAGGGGYGSAYKETTGK